LSDVRGDGPGSRVVVDSSGPSAPRDGSTGAQPSGTLGTPGNDGSAGVVRFGSCGAGTGSEGRADPGDGAVPPAPSVPAGPDVRRSPGRDAVWLGWDLVAFWLPGCWLGSPGRGAPGPAGAVFAGSHGPPAGSSPMSSAPPDVTARHLVRARNNAARSAILRSNSPDSAARPDAGSGSAGAAVWMRWDCCSAQSCSAPSRLPSPLVAASISNRDPAAASASNPSRTSP